MQSKRAREYDGQGTDRESILFGCPLLRASPISPTVNSLSDAATLDSNHSLTPTACMYASLPALTLFHFIAQSCILLPDHCVSDRNEHRQFTAGAATEAALICIAAVVVTQACA